MDLNKVTSSFYLGTWPLLVIQAVTIATTDGQLHTNKQINDKHKSAKKSENHHKWNILVTIDIC